MYKTDFHKNAQTRNLRFTYKKKFLKDGRRQSYKICSVFQ